MTDVVARKSEIHGLGGFAARPIKKWERFGFQLPETPPVWTGQDVVISPGYNFSCAPNATQDRCSMNLVIALRDIAEGEEITLPCDPPWSGCNCQECR